MFSSYLYVLHMIKCVILVDYFNTCEIYVSVKQLEFNESLYNEYKDNIYKINITRKID